VIERGWPEWQGNMHNFDSSILVVKKYARSPPVELGKKKKSIVP
jgi:hypothetical protein